MTKSNYIESETLELKSSLSEREEILETISALSNTKGGKILIGINPARRVIGADIGINTLENLANDIKSNTDPKVFPTVEVQKLDSKNIIVVSVPEHPIKPVFAKDKVFVRVGRTNQRATTEKIKQLLNASRTYDWDSRGSTDFSIAEISLKKLRTFLLTAEEERSSFYDDRKDVKTILKKLKLLKGPRPVNAALLLFGKEPQKYFLNSKLRCARFLGNEPIDFIDMQVIDGTLIEQVPLALNFIKKQINIGVRITGEPEREEIWEYPREALREAIINAVCHRDYEDSGNVQIRIFDNRLEVWSPGSLPYNVTLEDLKTVHHSQPRNLLIANCFYLIKYIEQWGTGTNRILRLCKEANLPEPLFDIKSGCVVVTFLKSTAQVIEQVPSKYHASTTQVPYMALINDAALEELGLTWDKFNEIVLSLSQVCPKSVPSYAFSIIILYVQKEVDILTLMNSLRQTNRTRFRNNILKPIIDEGFINYTIPDKPNSPKQKYIVTEKGKQLLKTLKLKE